MVPGAKQELGNIVERKLFCFACCSLCVWT